MILPPNMSIEKAQAVIADIDMRRSAYQSHDIDDVTLYCRRCGQSAEHILDNVLRCFGQPGVAAISHRRRPASAYGSNGDPNNPSAA